MRTFDRTDAARFPVPLDIVLREAGWQPGRWDMEQAEVWADTLRAHASPGGHRHTVLPAAVEVWAEFGRLRIEAPGPGRDIAPTPLLIDPLRCLHMARTFSDLGRALETEVCPLGAEDAGAGAALGIDSGGRVYSLDHAGDWYLGADIDEALATLLNGTQPARLAVGG